MELPQHVIDQYSQMFTMALQRGDEIRAIRVAEQAFIVGREAIAAEITADSYLDEFLPAELYNPFNEFDIFQVRDLWLINDRDFLTVAGVSHTKLQNVIQTLGKFGITWPTLPNTQREI